MIHGVQTKTSHQTLFPKLENIKRRKTKKMEKNDLEEKELKEADMEFERKEKNLLLPTKEIIKIKVSTKELWIQKIMLGTKTTNSVKFVWKILYIMLSENVVIIIVVGIAC
jgi:hypothetical protein